MRRTILALSMLLTASAQAATVNTDMVACRDRETIYELARTSMQSGAEIFMSQALRLSKEGLCEFLTEGTKVTIEESHWKGAACVRVDQAGCLWVVKSVLDVAD